MKSCLQFGVSFHPGVLQAELRAHQTRVSALLIEQAGDSEAIRDAAVGLHLQQELNKEDSFL